MNSYFTSVFTCESPSGLNALRNDLQSTKSTMSIEELQFTEKKYMRHYARLTLLSLRDLTKYQEGFCVKEQIG